MVWQKIAWQTFVKFQKEGIIVETTYRVVEMGLKIRIDLHFIFGLDAKILELIWKAVYLTNDRIWLLEKESISLLALFTDLTRRGIVRILVQFVITQVAFIGRFKYKLTWCGEVNRKSCVPQAFTWKDDSERICLIQES